MSGRGTVGQPFSLAEALALTSANFPVPGTTLEILRSISEDATGGAGLPTNTVIRSRYGTAINGSITLSGSDIIIRDAVVYDADMIDRTIDAISFHSGIKLDSPAKNVKIINCVIHDCTQGILLANSALVDVYGCIIYHNGYSLPDRGHGHGLYAGNTSAETVSIKHCVIFSNFGWGIHAYGSGLPPKADNIEIIECVAFGNGELAQGRRNPNVLVGCDSGWPRYGKIINCESYHRDLSSGIGVRLGNGLAGAELCTVQNNYCAGGLYPFYYSGNPDDGNWGDNDVSNNTFIGAPYDPTGLFPDNTILADYPDTGQRVAVFPNEYETGRANVAIYNWTLADSVIVDLSSVAGLAAGDSVNVANVQNFFVDIQVFTLDADKKITIDMRASERTVAAPQGWTAPETTFPRFGVFVVTKN